LGRYLCSQDTIDIALGLFADSSETAKQGIPCRYVIRIANASDHVWDVNVSLHVSPLTGEARSEPPVARFSRGYMVPPNRSTEVECHYDWCLTPVFILESSPARPHEYWQQELQASQRYRISAILTASTGQHLDRLDIYQELQG
jgi:hypothetical protein